MNDWGADLDNGVSAGGVGTAAVSGGGIPR